MTMTKDSKDNGSDNRWSTGMMTPEENGFHSPPPRAQLQSFTIESNLPNIEETEEIKRGDLYEDDKDDICEHAKDLPKPHDIAARESLFQTEVDQESNSSKLSSIEKDTDRRISTYARIRASENSSDTNEPARLMVESRVAHTDDFESSRTPETSISKTNPLNRHRKCSDFSKWSASSLTKLDLRAAEYQGNKYKETKSHTNSQRSSGIENNTAGDTTPPQVKCIHGLVLNKTHTGENISKKEHLKSIKTCVICEVTDDAERMTQLETSKLLLEIVYPHEFYDRFSRARHSKKSPFSQGNTKEAITICKPAKVTRKAVQPERTWNKVPQATNRLPEEGGTLQYNGNIPEKRRKQETVDETESSKKEIHLQCKAKTNALVITDPVRGQKLVLKGLKGWLLRKHDDCNNKMQRDIKQSLYQVSTLGMQFGLPDYNKSLHDRKPTSPRAATCLTARTQDNGLVIRTSTHSLGPRQHTMPSLPRYLLPGQSRGFGALQRDLTNIAGRLPETSANTSMPVKDGATLNSSQTSVENAISRVMKAGLSLPPITNDVKAPVT